MTEEFNLLKESIFNILDDISLYYWSLASKTAFVILNNLLQA
jgi:hypothetical protein